jgi:hypothetical protein
MPLGSGSRELHAAIADAAIAIAIVRVTPARPAR